MIFVVVVLRQVLKVCRKELLTTTQNGKKRVIEIHANKNINTANNNNRYKNSITHYLT